MNRTKVTVACQACQKKKVKCTGSAPCTTCSRSGHKCIFSNTAKKRGPRNGNVEVIRNSAHRIEYVLQNFPSLRDQIEQMLEHNGNKSNNNNKRSRQSSNVHSMRHQKGHVIVIDDDKINDGLPSFPYLVPTKSVPFQDDITIKPQRRQDQVDGQENLQPPIFCRPLPIYPSNMQRNHVDDFSSRSDINRYAQTGPLTSHSNISEVAPSATNPLLPPFIAKMEMSSSIQIKDQNSDQVTIENHLKLPVPCNMFKKQTMSMPIYNTSLGTQLLLPAPDLGMDFFQKSLISNSSQRPEGSLNNNDHNENSLDHGKILSDLNETFIKDEEKKSCNYMKISLPSPPSYLSSSPSPRSTCTNYCPPTPTSSSSPPLSPHIKATSYTPKRSSIHLLSKPAPWCANTVNDDHDQSLKENVEVFQQDELMEIDGSY